MNVKKVLAGALVCACLLTAPVLAQDPGVADTLVIMANVTPDFTTGSHSLEFQVWVYNDEPLIGATAGFTWDNPNFQLDSAVASPLIDASFEIGPFFFENNDIAVSNANQRFLIGGSALFGTGVPADPSGRRLWATYYFTTSDWQACDEISFDTLRFNSGSAFLFVTTGNVNLIPNFGGGFTVTDTACAPAANLVLVPPSLTFATQETGGNPATQAFNVNSDGDPVDFTLTENIPWLSATPGTGNTPQAVTVSIDNSGLTEGTYIDSIMVSSTTAGNSPLYEVVTVNVGPPPNLPPVLGAVAPQETTEGINLNFGVSATDPNGTTPVLTAANLPGSATFNDNGGGNGTFDWTPGFFDAGVYNVKFYATDEIVVALVDSIEVQVTVLDSNRAPVISYDMGQGTVVDEGGVLEFVVTATDPDLTTPSLSAHLDGSGSLAPNMAFVDSGNGVGVLTFSPDFTQGDGDPTLYDVVFEAADETDPGLTDATAPVSFSVFNVNQAPSVAPVSNQTVCADGTLEVTVSASDPDSDPLAMWVDPLVTNMTFDYPGGGSGTITFTPDGTQLGTYPTTVYASDGQDTAFTTFDINVVDCSATDTGTVMLSPALLYWFQQNNLNDLTGDVYIGDFVGGHGAGDVDPASVMIDGAIAPSSVEVLASYGDFTGPVLKVSYLLRPYIMSLGPFMDTINVPFVVSGDFDGGAVFNVSANMTLVGHRSGDVNADGSVNVGDITALVSAIFQGKPADALIAGDVDGECGLTVSDVSYFVNNLFTGGPALHSTPCPENF